MDIMNIFLDKRSLDDESLSEALTLSAQVLVSAHQVRGHLVSTNSGCRVSMEISYDAPGLPQIDVNHKACVWVRTSIANYEWLAAQAEELAEVFVMRHGHDHHDAIPAIDWLSANTPELPDIGLTQR